MFGELLGNWLVLLSEHGFISRFKITSANIARAISVVVKLATVVVAFFVFSLHHLNTWLMVQGMSTLFAGLLCIGFLMMRVGRPIAAFHSGDVVFGLLIMTTQGAQAVQFTMDRIVLSEVATPAVVAAYSAATRGVQVALIPIAGIMRNLYAPFFALGKGGLGATRQFALSNLPKVIVAGLLTATAFVAGSDIFAVNSGPWI